MVRISIFEFVLLLLSVFLVIFVKNGSHAKLSSGLAQFQLLNRDESSAAIAALSQSAKYSLKRSKRSAVSLNKNEPEIPLGEDFDLVEKLSQVAFNLTAFDRTFQIRILNMGSIANQRILASGFQIFTVSPSGQRRETKLPLDHFFNGILENSHDPSIGQDSEVFGYIDHNGKAMMTIKTREETYSIEPLHRFSESVPQSSNDSSSNSSSRQHHQADYIIYRSSDLRMPNDSHFCGAAKYKRNHSPALPFRDDLERFVAVAQRKKREQPIPYVTTQPTVEYNLTSHTGDDLPEAEQIRGVPYSTGFDETSTNRDSCELCLVADYTFYQQMAHSDETAATSYMIYLVSQVNNIYRKEFFGSLTGDKLFNFGFTIKRIEVHPDPTPSTDNPSRRNYNAEQKLWDQGVLLESFSRTGNHAGCCLSHLFTHRPFDGGVLGLAYLANADPYKVGGICSSSGSFFVNTGWSSTMFADGTLVPSQQAVLVLAHELGHNWGSPHDLDNKDCAPSSNYGGKYIMWMYSVPGYETNNWHFSSCSLSAMGEVLRAKAGNCFRPRPRAICGNGFVEGIEQCDAGPPGLRDEDPCCTSDCKLRNTALCSDANQVCCRGCLPASSDTLCWRDSDLAESSSCLGKAYCNGSAAECEAREPLSDKPCFDNGQCRNGTCLPFCEVHGYRTCMCDSLEFACNYCCFVNETCQPLPVGSEGLPKILSDGRPCPYGYCKQGICVKSVMNTVEKFWTYLTEIDVNNLAKFMRDNIVGVTILIALVVWIPLSCTIWCLDKRQERELEEAWKRRERYAGEMVERRSKVYYLPRPGMPVQKAQIAVVEASPNVQQQSQPSTPYDNLGNQTNGSHFLGVNNASGGHAPYNRVFSLSPSQLSESGTPARNTQQTYYNARYGRNF